MLAKNRFEDDRELKAALELKAVPEAVDKKLRQLYAELPDQVPTGKKRTMGKGVKRGIAALSSLAAAFLILVCAAAVNPALAESIPLLGKIFQRTGNSQGWKNGEKTLESLEAYAQPLEGVTAQGAAEGFLEKPVAVTAEEVYYDGHFLFVGLSMDVGISDGELFTKQSGEGSGPLMIDGEWIGEQGKTEYGFFELGTAEWVRGEDGRYVCKRGFLLPERLWEKESLSITLRVWGIYRWTMGMELTLNSSPLDLAFTAEKNNAPVLSFAGGGIEMGGVELEKGVATPAGTAVTLTLPQQYDNPECGISFEGRGAIGSAGGYSDPGEVLPDGRVRQTLIAGGYSEDEERRLLIPVFDKNGSDQFVAVFLVDPHTGEISLGSEEDIVFFEDSAYYCLPEEMLANGAQNKIALASHKNGGNELLLFIATKDEHPRQDLRIEVWQDDTLLGSRDDEKQRSEHFYFHSFAYEDENGDTTRYEVGRNQYIFGVLGMEDLEKARPVTIKLYDGRTEELLMDETVQLK